MAARTSVFTRTMQKAWSCCSSTMKTAFDRPGIAVQLFGGIAILTGISSLTNYSSCLQTIASDLLPGHVGNHFLRGLQRGRRVQARP